MCLGHLTLSSKLTIFIACILSFLQSRLHKTLTSDVKCNRLHGDLLRCKTKFFGQSAVFQICSMANSHTLIPLCFLRWKQWWQWLGQRAWKKQQLLNGTIHKSNQCTHKYTWVSWPVLCDETTWLPTTAGRSPSSIVFQTGFVLFQPTTACLLFVDPCCFDSSQITLYTNHLYGQSPINKLTNLNE